MNNTVAQHISERFIKPKYVVKESKQPYYLTPIDISMLSYQYSQFGLLFNKPSHFTTSNQEYSTHELLKSLENSLSLALVHFYPLAGQFTTEVYEDHQHECLIYIDCNKGPGLRLIHAALDMNISDLLSPLDVPSVVVQSLFDHHLAPSHDGHTRPLVSIQVTELVDGVFIGCSMNHIADGTSYWNFWNVWSEIHMSSSYNKEVLVTRLPVHERWFPDGYGPAIRLPFVHPDEFIRRYEAPTLRERVFHFSGECIAKLKAKANKESETNNISSFQALCALVWRSVVRAKHLPNYEVITCRLVANNRHRVDPPLPTYYFGDCIFAINISTTAGELLEHNLGWAASLLHQSVVDHNDKVVRDRLEQITKYPCVNQPHTLSKNSTMTVANSPRFDVYGNEFGLGKAVAVRSGFGNKYTGIVYSYPGQEGGGSIDLEVSLPPDSMTTLESDMEFMSTVSQINVGKSTL